MTNLDSLASRMTVDEVYALASQLEVEPGAVVRAVLTACS